MDAANLLKASVSAGLQNISQEEDNKLIVSSFFCPFLWQLCTELSPHEFVKC
jgi:hypothetical protein